jgi:hypothetical protein
MARRRFGADLQAIAWRTVTIDGTSDVVQLAPSAGDITAWDSETAGTQITDLTDSLGVALTGGVIVADGFGRIDFFGPDTLPETVTVWLDAGLGVRQMLTASDVGAQVVDLAGTVAQTTTDVASLTTTVAGHETRIATIEAAGGGGGGGGTGISESSVGYLLLDDEVGTDDAKLGTCLTAAAAATYPPMIRWGNRQVSFATIRTPFEAMRLSGPEGYSNPERNSQTKMAGRVALSMSGGWFTMAGSTSLFAITIQNMAFTGGSTARVLDQGASSAVWYCLQMRNIYSSGLRNVLGSYSTKLLITAAQFDGSWELNNCYDTAIHIGGSDCAYPMFDGMLIDSGTAFNSAGSATGHPHVWLDFLEKSNAGAWYMTTEGAWGGVLLTGSATGATGSNLGGAITFHGGIWEGRNAGAPCNGAVYRQSGGLARMYGVTMNYGMSSPAGQGHTPTDGGMAHVYGNGRLRIHGPTYDRANGVTETGGPLAYAAAGSHLRVRDADSLSKSNPWSGLPRVTGPGTIDADSTVTVF